MTAGLMDRLLRLAGVSDLRTELERVQTERDDLRRRLDQIEERLRTLRVEKDEARRIAGERHAEALRRRRRVPVSLVLRDLMAARRGQLQFRAAAAGAPAREQRLLDASPSYAEAIAGRTPPDPNFARHINLDGLDWWVPVGASGPEEIASAVGKEALPYLALLHSREVCTGGIMLDLGAHDGGTAIPRVLLGDVEAVYCAEPDPVNYACLVANTVHNGLRGFVLPDRVAIAAKSGTSRLLRTRKSRGHRVLADGQDADGSTIDIPMRTLDAWIGDLGVEPAAISFVKSDTQGFELQVLAGAASLVTRRHIAWQLEYAPRLLELAGSAPSDFLMFVQRHFTHFIDLRVDAPGKRRRPIADLSSALEYLDARDGHTDIIVYSAAHDAAG